MELLPEISLNFNFSGAIYIDNSNYSDSLYYTYTDNQGSVIALTDESGNVKRKYAYDPWGARRNASNWTQNDNGSNLIISRGYTGHEHLDAFGIINMNGRVYDPTTAMFFSPDPFVQSPGDWSNYNRYSYVSNNPTRFTDPSGYVKGYFDTPKIDPYWSRIWNLYSEREPLNGSKIDKSGGGMGQNSWNNYIENTQNGYTGGYGNFLNLLYEGDFVNGKLVTGTTAHFTQWVEVIDQNTGKVKYSYAPKVFYKTETGWVEGGNALYTIGMIINAAGFFSSAGEYSNVMNGSWRGLNGKWNSLEWGGNKWTGARANALSKAGYFKIASRGFFFAGAFISGYQGYSAFQKGDYTGVTKSGLDIGMGAFATFGGPPGWIIGGGYFALDALGAFDSRPFINVPYNPSIYSVQDNTFVAPSIIRHQ